MTRGASVSSALRTCTTTRKVTACSLAEREEVSTLVVFLASDLSSYSTGGLVPVDGGILARGACTRFRRLPGIHQMLAAAAGPVAVRLGSSVGSHRESAA